MDGVSIVKTVAIAALALLAGIGAIAVVKSQIKPGEPIATLEEFAAASKGMTYAQVVSIVGEPSELIEQRDMGGYVLVSYEWLNDDQSYMRATFQNNQLADKQQQRLPATGVRVIYTGEVEPELRRQAPSSTGEKEIVFVPVEGNAPVTVYQPPIVSLAQYNQLRKGMTYEQVARFIGVHGQMESDYRSDFGSHSMFKWENPDGSSMIASFDDGKLSTIMQFSLK